MGRYQVVPKSQSGHCCFDFTVVDTSRQQTVGWKEEARPYFVDGEPQWESVCECFDLADAELIAAALNDKEQSK